MGKQAELANLATFGSLVCAGTCFATKGVGKQSLPTLLPSVA